LVNWLVKPLGMALLARVFMQHVFAAWIDPETAKGYTTVLLIGVPIILQVYFNSGLTYLLMRCLLVEHSVAAPGPPYVRGWPAKSPAGRHHHPLTRPRLKAPQ
jgi:ACR3 family arsenite efflux pump ArsB